MQPAIDEKLARVRAADDVIARRHKAARRAGIPITDALSFDWVPAEVEPEPVNTAKVNGIYRPQETRALTDEEWRSIADLLPDQKCARLTYRQFLNNVLAYCIAGAAWSSVGHGERFSATRERVRAKQGHPVWSKVARRVENWLDHVMVSQMLRCLRYLETRDMTLLAVVGQRRIRSKQALAKAAAKRAAYLGGVKPE